MRVGEIQQFCKLPEEAQSLMRAAMSQLNFSARVYHRILKLARTIADLAGSEDTHSVHLAEALQSPGIDDGVGIYLGSENQRDFLFHVGFLILLLTN